MIFHQPGNSRGNFNYSAHTYSGREYAPHFHKNMELILVLDGSMEVTGNGACSSLDAGEAVINLLRSHMIGKECSQMMRSGFQSIRSFNLCFKRIMGKTPNDYRLTN